MMRKINWTQNWSPEARNKRSWTQGWRIYRWNGTAKSWINPRPSDLLLHKIPENAKSRFLIKISNCYFKNGQAQRRKHSAVNSNNKFSALSILQQCRGMAAYKSYKPAVRKEIKNSFSRSEGWVYMSGHIQHYVLSPTTHRTFFLFFCFLLPTYNRKIK